MGWLWASPSPPKPSSPVANEPAKAPSTAQTKAPNEPVDPEIQKFFDLFKEDSSAQKSSTSASASSPTSTTSSASSSTEQPSSSSSWFSLRKSSTPDSDTPQAPARLPPLSESLLPTEMSCRQAFDQAWACNGLGGQWNAVYRYGSMRSCSEQWDDFWFCMRTKSQTGPVKEELVRARYREKEYRKYGPGKPSSEDVWDSRDRKLEPGEAFSQRLDDM